MKRVVVEGASGYSGMELTRILARHPEVELVGATSGRWAGSTVRERLGLTGPAGELTYRKSILDDDADLAAEAVLAATPADASRELLIPDSDVRGL